MGGRAPCAVPGLGPGACAGGAAELPGELAAEDGRDPTFSPDGKRILYWTGQEGEASIPSGRVWVLDRETGERKQYHPEFADALVANFNEIAKG